MSDSEEPRQKADLWTQLDDALKSDSPEFCRPANWFILTFQTAQNPVELEKLGELVALSLLSQVEETMGLVNKDERVL